MVSPSRHQSLHEGPVRNGGAPQNPLIFRKNLILRLIHPVSPESLLVINPCKHQPCLPLTGQSDHTGEELT